MSLTITAKNIKFLADESEHNYVVTVNPAYKPLNINIEGDYEVATTGLQSHAFAQELILQPDTTFTPPRIAKMIRIRKKNGANSGKITHRLGNDVQALFVNLTAAQKEQEIVPAISPKTTQSQKAAAIIPPSKEEKEIKPIMPPAPKVVAKNEEVLPPINMEEKKKEPLLAPKIPEKKLEIPAPKLNISRKEIYFPKVAMGVMQSELFELKTENIAKLQLQVPSPFRISLDNRTFSQMLTLPLNPKGQVQQVYLQVLALKEGTYTGQLSVKYEDKILQNLFVKAICPKNPTQASTKPQTRKLPWLPIAAGLCLMLGLGYWIWGGKKQPNVSAVSATVLSTSNMALPADPACKPSLYQKLKEKTSAVRYTCVDRNCDTAIVREILTFATGSKAFKYVSVHNAETPNDCGEWVDNLFKTNEIDLIFTDKVCNIGNMDMSSSVCEDKKCVFMIPCGNSEGFLKVLNKEIRRRKAEKMKAALKIVRAEWKGNS